MDSESILPPPTPSPVGFEPPVHAAPQVTVLDVVPPTKRSKKGWIVGGIAVVALVAGLVAFGVSRNSTSGREPYSLQAAAAAATEADLIGFEMTMGVMGQEIVMTAQMDIGNKLMSMNMEMPGGMGQLDAIIDGTGNTMYLNADAMGFGDQAPTPWISMDLTKIPGGTQDIFGASTSNPLAVAEYFANAENVQEIGMEEFRGEQVRHYRVVLSTQDALAANPDLQTQAEQFGGELPDELTYDVYVTEASLLRRMTFEMPIAGQTMSAEVVLTELDGIEPIVIPPADQVTDMTSQLGG